MLNPSDNSAFLRIINKLPRNLGPKILQQLQARLDAAAAGMPERGAGGGVAGLMSIAADMAQSSDPSISTMHRKGLRNFLAIMEILRIGQDEGKGQSECLRHVIGRDEG